MSEYQAVLFDMDGVTVATANAWRELEAEEILPAAGEGIDIETIRALSPEDSYERLESMDEVTLRVDRDEFVGLYDEYAEEVYLERATLLDGYEPLLADLRDEELALGLVSASCRDWVALVLERFDLGDAYDVVVSSTDIDGPSKPNPTPYLVAAEQIGVDPEQCIVVEDSAHGIAAATAAGAYCIALRGAGNQETDLSSADAIVTDPTELRTHLFDLLPSEDTQQCGSLPPDER